MNHDLPWAAAKQQYPIGRRVQGVVTEHVPFGVFIQLPNCPYRGLIPVIEFKDQGSMSEEEYPPIGSMVTCVVLGFKENGQQIWAGMKPSQLASASLKNGE